MSGIKVLLVHSYELGRRGLRRMLDGYEDIQVVGEAGNAIEVVDQVEALSPDVILLDAEMPQVSGLETTRILKERGFPGAVIVLSIDVQRLDAALRLGAGGYLVQDAQADEIVSAIRRVPEGGFVFGASLMKTAQAQELALRYLAGQESGTPQAPSESTVGTGMEAAQESVQRSELTGESEREQPGVAAKEEALLNPGEQRLLELLGRGSSDEMIARALATEEATVKARINILLRKLHLGNRAQAVAYARRTGPAPGDTQAIVEGAASGPIDARRTEGRDIVEEKATVEHAVEALAMDAPQPPQAVAELVTSPPIAELDTIVSDVELVISPPVEPSMVLKLHQWLTDLGGIDIGEIVGSWSGDTVMLITLRRPIPLLRMLAESPNVAHATEEPYVGSGERPVGGVMSPREMLGIGGGRTVPKRFRLVLKA